MQSYRTSCQKRYALFVVISFSDTALRNDMVNFFIRIVTFEYISYTVTHIQMSIYKHNCMVYVACNTFTFLFCLKN